MATEFQQKKLMHLFNTFYDYNNDGVVEWADFQACADTMCKIHGWEKNSEKHKDALSSLEDVWKGLQKYADKNTDNRITKDEWIQMWDECYKNKSSLPDWQLNYCKFFFKMSDTSGDGVLDLGEYKALYKNFGFSDEECESAFNKISDNGQRKVDEDAFKVLWTEFILDDTQTAAGNQLFGGVKK